MPNFQILDALGDELSPTHHRLLRELFGNGPTGTDPVESKRLQGQALCFLTEVMGLTSVQAWRIVRPSSRAGHAAAQVAVAKMKRWYHETYPLSILEAFQKFGVTVERLVAILNRGLEAKRVRWDNDEGQYVPTNLDDHKEQRQTVLAMLQVAELDKKTRQEMAIGKAEMQKMELNTGLKHETVQDWTKWMESQHDVTIQERAQAAKEMKLIAVGRQIIQEEGREQAEMMRQRAVAAGFTGEEDDEENGDS